VQLGSHLVFVPPGTLPSNPRPAIVFAHGDVGLVWTNGSTPLLRENYRKWANIAVYALVQSLHSPLLNCSCANTIALFVDSFTPRNSLVVDPVSVRTYDIYAGYKFLTTDATYSSIVDSTKIYALGWESGGTAGLCFSVVDFCVCFTFLASLLLDFESNSLIVMAAMSNTDTHFVNNGLAFAGSTAFYPCMSPR
jgi:hypothetical protein